MYRDYVKKWSPALQRNMECLWFGQFGRPVLMFPAGGGRFFQLEDMHLIDSMADRVENGELQLVLVDSCDTESWLDETLEPADRGARHVQYDAYLRNELTPYVFNRAQRGDLVVYGADLGAYHAANFAARYPDVVSRAICFSGLYDIHPFTDGYSDENCYFHSPTWYIPNMDAEWVSKLSRLTWMIAAGEYDPYIQPARDFSSVLWSKGIQNRLDVWGGVGGHDWESWKHHVRDYI